MAGMKVIKKGDRVIKEYVDGKTGKITAYERGLRLEVSDFKGDWYPAKVIDVDRDDNEVLVHYEKWPSRFDEWIKTDSNRLRPTTDTNIIKIQFKVGERVEALWNTDGRKYPGTIKAILPNDYYEVLFDDGIKCKKKERQIFKIQRITRGRAAREVEKPLKSSPRLSTVLSSTATRLLCEENSFYGRKKSKDRGIVVLDEDIPDHPENTVIKTEPKDPDDEDSEVKNPSLTRTPVHHSIFDPITTDLGKRKRAYHDYSLFLKIPKRSPKRTLESEKKRHSDIKIKKEKEEPETDGESSQDAKSSGGETTSVSTPDQLPAKRTRKISMKAMENLATGEGSPRRKYTKRRSSLAGSSFERGGTPTPEFSIEHESSGFIDECGNAVNIEQTTDGGWICPIENCGKHFRKDSLLQMHLKHYHPGSKIQFLGKKLNVFEMAIARTRTDASPDSKEKEVISTASPETHATTGVKTRRKSSPCRSLPEPIVVKEEPGSTSAASGPTTADIPGGIKEEPDIQNTEPAGKQEITADADSKQAYSSIKTNGVCVLLEKININKYQNKGTRVSQRGRLIPRRKWKRIYAETDSDPSDASDDESGFLPPTCKKQRQTRKMSESRGMSSRLTEKQEKQQQLLKKDAEEVEKKKDATKLPQPREQPVPETVPKKAKRSGITPSTTPRFPGRPGRRGMRISKKAFMCGFKAKKLDLICDELIQMGKKKRLLAKPRFEDVQVDVINCECGLEEEFGLMMQCELCQSWQHGNCYNIYEVTQLPQYYVCSFCKEPKGFRKSARHEWYQEVHTTGRLPRFNFGPKSDPVAEDKMRASNDLLNCLAHVQNLLRSTQLKISILNSAADHPKLVLWSQDHNDPFDTAHREEFKCNFRSVLRHLLKYNTRDPAYISKLRRLVEQQTETPTVEQDQLQKILKTRFHSRASKIIDDEQRLEKAIVEKYNAEHSAIAMSQPQGVELNKFSPYVLSNGCVMDHVILDSFPAPLQHQASVEDKLKIFTSELQEFVKKGLVPVFLSKDIPSKYVLVTCDKGATDGKIARVAQKVIFPDGRVSSQVIGMGKVFPSSSGLNFVQAVTVTEDGGHCSIEHLLQAQTLKKLYLCKSCRKNLNVDWSRKEFALSNPNLCVHCKACANDSVFKVPAVPPLPNPAIKKSSGSGKEKESNHSTTFVASGGCKTLKDLCEDFLSSSKKREKSKSVGDESREKHIAERRSRKSEHDDILVPQKVTSETCRVNLHATIVKEQVVLDLHLNTIETKLKELQGARFTDPQSAFARLKDLEELKKKVRVINDNIEFMRNLEMSNQEVCE